MIDWSTLDFGRLWPAGLILLAALLFGALWRWRQPAIFPDIALVTATRRFHGLPDRLVTLCGALILLLLVLGMMQPSVVLQERVEQRARDFIILVDTSRSMRHDTRVRRDSLDLRYERRAGAFFETVDDPATLPFVARFELARESLFRFLNGRQPDDRVALMYFNDNVHPVSALTGNIAFLTDQLGSMDDYVNWGTNIASAMDSSLSLIERYPGNNKRTMILLTDAETRSTGDLEAQVQRLADSGVAFYVLWITTGDLDLTSGLAGAFLKLVESVGTVVTIRNPDADNLRDALLDISRTEAYRYDEVRRRTVHLQESVEHMVRPLLLIWLLAVGTRMHPAFDRSAFHLQIPPADRVSI